MPQRKPHRPSLQGSYGEGYTRLFDGTSHLKRKGTAHRHRYEHFGDRRNGGIPRSSLFQPCLQVGDGRLAEKIPRSINKGNIRPIVRNDIAFLFNSELCLGCELTSRMMRPRSINYGDFCNAIYCFRGFLNFLVGG